MNLQVKALEREIQVWKSEINNSIVVEQSMRLRHDQADAQLKARINDGIKQDNLKAANARAIKQADYDLLKEGFKDPVV